MEVSDMRRMVTAFVMTVVLLAGGVIAQQKGPQDVDLQAAIRTETVDGDLNGAIKQYGAIVSKYKADRGVSATALVHMAACYQKLGDTQAQKIYERLLSEFGDQKEAAAEARTRLAALQSPAAPQTKQAARQIWADARPGTPSPDGRYLSFVDSETGDLAVRDLSTGTNRRLTNTGGWYSGYAADSVLSPDDRQVAYTLYDKENKVELRVASIAAGEPVRATVVLRIEQNDYLRPIAWMPGGEQLLVLRSLSDRTNQIGRVTIQDGSFRSIKSLDWRYPDLLSLSPDGQYVAYDVPAGDNGSPRDIFVLATDGSRETRVVQNPANDSSPLWSPDGSQLLFLSDRTGSNALWTVSIENGRPNGPAASIKTDVGSISLLGMTKSGALYYFSRTAALRNLYVTDLDAMHATKPPVPATERFINRNVCPTWSRDGEYLAYYSFRDTSISVLVIRSAKTGDERTVPLPTRVASRFQGGPKWFPDNRSVLVESGDAQGSGFGFYRLALDTGNTELLAHVPRNVSSYDLSPDGRTIFYAILVDSRDKVMRFDIDSHRETELRNVVAFIADNAFPAFPGVETVSLAVSPDGLQLARTLLGGVVEVMPTAEGQSREVFRPAVRAMGTGQLRQALAWTPDQRFLLFVQGDGALWKVPALGGKAEKVGISMGFIKNPAVHPDGKQIVFDAAGEGGGGPGGVWALENFLPAVNAKK
jgi:Tol biopolymer transport system component